MFPLQDEEDTLLYVYKTWLAVKMDYKHEYAQQFMRCFSWGL